MKEIKTLQDAYSMINQSYQQKKADAWWELLEEIPWLKESHQGTILDIGGGNGRNLRYLSSTLVVCMDLSLVLLNSYQGHEENQRVAGAFPNLPFRERSAEKILAIAVIHHLPNKFLREQSFYELDRILISEGLAIATVWRKWRDSLKPKLVQRIRDQKPIDDLVDHHRPWKSNRGEVIGTRFYHYFTWKEIIESIKNTSFQSVEKKMMGGKSKRDNFLVELKKKQVDS